MNIAEILRHCPEGTKLYSPVWGNVKLISVDFDSIIRIKIHNQMQIILFGDGQYSLDGECVLFPSKEQRNWNTFRIPVKNGDIMMTVDDNRAFIATGKYDNGYPIAHCGINIFNKLIIYELPTNGWTTKFYIPASEMAKNLLFDKLNKAGCRWNSETLRLEGIKTPAFKRWDVIKDNVGNLHLYTGTLHGTHPEYYVTLISNSIIRVSPPGNPYSSIYRINEFVLASDEEKNILCSRLKEAGYYIDTENDCLAAIQLKPFDKVLVRSRIDEIWHPDILLRVVYGDKLTYKCTGNINYKYCIPYNGNEHLSETTDMLSD